MLKELKCHDLPSERANGKITPSSRGNRLDIKYQIRKKRKSFKMSRFFIFKQEVEK